MFALNDTKRIKFRARGNCRKACQAIYRNRSLITTIVSQHKELRRINIKYGIVILEASRCYPLLFERKTNYSFAPAICFHSDSLSAVLRF